MFIFIYHHNNADSYWTGVGASCASAHSILTALNPYEEGALVPRRPFPPVASALLLSICVWGAVPDSGKSKNLAQPHFSGMRSLAVGSTSYMEADLKKKLLFGHVSFSSLGASCTFCCCSSSWHWIFWSFHTYLHFCQRKRKSYEAIPSAEVGNGWLRWALGTSCPQWVQISAVSHK